MKQNVKIFLIALVIGMVSSYLVCYKFDNPLTLKAMDSKITYFYVGSYNDLNSAITKKNNYKKAIVYNDSGVYKVVIGAYKNKDVIDLMTSYFNDANVIFYQGEAKVKSDFVKTIETYEALIKTSSKDNYGSINSYILDKFLEYTV